MTGSAPLALLEADHHAGTVDIGDLRWGEVVDGPSTFWDRWQADAVEETRSEGPSMDEVVTNSQDLAKNVFQVHGIAANGNVLVRRQLRRGEVLKFFQSVPPR
ncbi:hypothetical protein J2848_007006 [Azospirillum lipoferum]|nr:hypothetical protein [Azospirillum lipoferum]